MTDSSKALQRIEVYFEEFCTGVRDCINAEFFVRADLLDAYDRLARLRDRFKKEKNNLDPGALAALTKVFENNVFIHGMMNIRQVAEHVKKRGEELVIYTADNRPITLNAVLSAMPMFAASRVTLTDITGSPYHLDHLRMLREAEKRITKAMNKAGFKKPERG